MRERAGRARAGAPSREMEEGAGSTQGKHSMVCMQAKGPARTERT